MAFVFTVAILAITTAGSIWTMHPLNTNRTPMPVKTLVGVQ